MSLYDKLKTGIIGGGGLAVGKIFSLKPIDGSGDFGAWRASDGTRRNSAGVIVTEPTNMPRADYKFGRTCPAILSEPLSQNLALWSSKIDTSLSEWVLGSNTEKIGQVLAPNNELEAFRYKSINATNNTSVRQFIDVSTNTDYTFSCWLRSDNPSLINGGFFRLQYTAGDNIDLNLSEIITNEWQRFDISLNSANATQAIITTFTTLTVGAEIDIWGAQLEQSSFSTSYMATAGGVTTRQPDIIEQLQSTTESFNSPKGTIFLKMASITTDDEERKISFFGDPNDNEIRIRYYNQGIGVRMIVDGVNVASFSTQQLDQTPFRNIAFNWDETSCSFWVDGEQIGSAILTESYPADTLDRADITGDNPFRGWLEELSVYDNNDIDMEDLTDYNTFEIMANNLNYTVQ